MGKSPTISRASLKRPHHAKNVRRNTTESPTIKVDTSFSFPFLFSLFFWCAHQGSSIEQYRRGTIHLLVEQNPKIDWPARELFIEPERREDDTPQKVVVGIFATSSASYRIVDEEDASCRHSWGRTLRIRLVVVPRTSRNFTRTIALPLSFFLLWRSNAFSRCYRITKVAREDARFVRVTLLAVSLSRPETGRCCPGVSRKLCHSRARVSKIQN